MSDKVCIFMIVNRLISLMLEVGNLVVFCKNPPKSVDHCNVWEWDIGLVVAYEKQVGLVTIFSKNKTYRCAEKWVDNTESLWIPGTPLPPGYLEEKLGK